MSYIQIGFEFLTWKRIIPRIFSLLDRSSRIALIKTCDTRRLERSCFHTMSAMGVCADLPPNFRSRIRVCLSANWGAINCFPFLNHVQSFLMPAEKNSQLQNLQPIALQRLPLTVVNHIRAGETMLANVCWERGWRLFKSSYFTCDQVDSALTRVTKFRIPSEVSDVR